MKCLCGHDLRPMWYRTEWGDNPPGWVAAHLKSNPCTDCAWRDYRAMQALRAGEAFLVGLPGEWKAFGSGDNPNASRQRADPADAILEVL